MGVEDGLAQRTIADKHPERRAINKADELVAAVMCGGIGYYPRVALMQARVELAKLAGDVFELDCDVCMGSGVKPGQDWADCAHSIGICPDCKEDCDACKGEGVIAIKEAKNDGS